MSEEEIISLDSLKNPECQNGTISAEIQDASPEDQETHLEYKKKLNKKVSDFTDEEKTKYNKLAQKHKRKNEKNKEEEKKSEEEIKLNDEKKNNLYNQLYVLKQKFPENTNEIIISKDMNLKTLEEKKSLILQIITQKNSESVVFETLLLMARTGERGLNYFDVKALDGYAENLNETRYFETKEIRDSDGHLILPKGKRVNSDFTVKYYDNNLGIYVTKSGTNVRTGISNYVHETRLNDEKRFIFVLKNEYLQEFLNDFRDITVYGKSSHFVDDKTVRTENLNISMP